ncbi:AP-3 complex subunit mu-1-like [Chironomus tepperi]|uniref:AP-3 complex subunit mu-1-like n=1 Tax=Chironomus tepperi TaxID=113505 RepID=UPI00391F9E4E
MESLFIINTQGDVFLEKHWRSVISKSICDYFLDKLKVSNDVIPVIPTSFQSTNLVSIGRSGIYLVSVCKSEISPLFVLEFLHRVVDTFIDYFSECNETIIKENYVVIYELLDEMLDNGFPLATESNVLKELIKPPNILRSIANSVTGKTNFSDTLPVGSLSAIPWRKSGVKYTNNEAYFDVIEEVDAIIDRSGATIFAEISGEIQCLIKLSGMPDLSLSFINPRILDDVSFHPCVRYKRWDTERVVSFRLMSYHVTSQTVPIPIYVRQNIHLKSGEQGKLDITVGPKTTLGRTLESVKIEVLFPKSVVNCSLVTTQGKYVFDQNTKILNWDVGKIDVQKLPNIRGSVTTMQGCTIESMPSINVQFTISQLAVSGLKVNRLDMYGDVKYKPFKGVKYITKAGKFQIRL